jgi:hypothetical protein
VGQVVTVGQDVMRVVPEGSTLELEVYALNKDIGFIKVGQEAFVKLEAFPFTRHGTITAHVTKIVADAIPEPMPHVVKGILQQDRRRHHSAAPKGCRTWFSRSL